jgi:hypothetical protein
MLLMMLCGRRRAGKSYFPFQYVLGSESICADFINRVGLAVDACLALANP